MIYSVYISILQSAGFLICWYAIQSVTAQVCEQMLVWLKKNLLGFISVHFFPFYHLGILKDDITLHDAKITPNVKIMVVGSTIGDVMTVQPPDPSTIKPIKVEEGKDNIAV